LLFFFPLCLGFRVFLLFSCSLEDVVIPVIVFEGPFC
jgi:hypothetical protein